MLSYGVRLFVIFMLLIGSLSLSLAQNLATISTVNGVLVDYPENWEAQNPEDFDDVVGFFNGSMGVRLSIVPLEGFSIDPADLVEFFVSEVEDEDDDIGDFEEAESYIIDETWDAARAQRVRSDNRLIEVIAISAVNDFSVVLRGSFRIGAADFFLPIFDDIMASVRAADAEVVITHGSSAQRPLTDGMIGSILDPLDIGALNTNFITEDEQYQFEYPNSWDIRNEADGSITIIERTSTKSTLFARLIISPATLALDSHQLVQERFDEAVEVSAFMLNDLPASRVIIEDEANNVRRVVMATIRGDVQAVLDVTVSIAVSDKTDAILRAMLYSVRENGDPFVLSIAGEAIRTGLLSAEIYGSASANSQDIVIEGIALDTVYITRNGRYTFNYPSEWFEALISGYIVISNDDDIELFDPSRNDVQLIFDFIDDIQFLDADFSVVDILNDLIVNDEFEDNWSDITEFESLGRAAAYADFDIFDSDSIVRLYYVELEASENIFVRVDMIIDEDDFDDFNPIVLAMLETVRFQD